MSKERESLYITKTKAKEKYYLTDKMIGLIGEPDLLLKNPHYKKAAKMQLFLIDRIEEWVSKNLEMVEKARIRRKKLSKIQIERHNKIRKEMIEKAEIWEPEIYLDSPQTDLVRDAIWYYRDRYEDFGGKLTHKALMAYIRHQYTNYHSYLDEIELDKGKTGVRLLYSILRPKVDEMVEQYLVDNPVVL